MRDKKVRAWDKVREEYLYSGKFPSMWQFYKELENRDIRHWETEDYTGLKDKYGIEIYEGDIVKYESFYPQVVSLRPLSGYDPFISFAFQPKIWEVIGNIYENPELLEEKK